MCRDQTPSCYSINSLSQSPHLSQSALAANLVLVNWQIFSILYLPVVSFFLPTFQRLCGDGLLNLRFDLGIKKFVIPYFSPAAKRCFSFPCPFHSWFLCLLWEGPASVAVVLNSSGEAWLGAFFLWSL